MFNRDTVLSKQGDFGFQDPCLFDAVMMQSHQVKPPFLVKPDGMNVVIRSDQADLVAFLLPRDGDHLLQQRRSNPLPFTHAIQGGDLADISNHAVSD